MMGISRSATVVCAYLVATTPMIVSEAIEFVQQKRSIVHPNSSFQRQLEAYALQFYGKDAKVKRPTKFRITNEVADRIRRLAGLKSVHQSAGAPTKAVRTSSSVVTTTKSAVATMTTTAVAEAEIATELRDGADR